MAINKVVNKSTKSHGAMRNVIEYVLQNKKVKEGYVSITGPYAPEVINWDNVYKAFLQEKRLWHKDNGRMYAHNIISFHKDEKITPEECLEFGQAFVDKFFPGYQCLISVHQDRDHLHIHIVTNSVSYIDGKKLHMTKHDLEHQKEFTNKLCLERGLSVTEKGKHFDGSEIEEGHVTAWSKDKYNLLRSGTKSYVADCATAVLESKDLCCSKDDFVEAMEERGWHTTWTDSKKHITFQNENGDKVRDSNLTKTFEMEISKEALLYEFERNEELIKRYRAKERKETADLERYYAEVEAAQCDGLGTETIGDNTVSTEKTDQTESDDTKALIRKVESDINDSKAARGAVIDAENKSKAREAERRSQEQQRSENKKRSRRHLSQEQRYSDPEF